MTAHTITSPRGPPSGLSGNQPLISQINLMGKLWGVPLKTTTGMEMMFGIFQHFNYFDSEEVIDGSGVSLTRFRKLPVWDRV